MQRAQQLSRRIDRVSLSAELRAPGSLAGTQGEAEQRPCERIHHVAAKEQVRRELIGKLLHKATARVTDLETRVLMRGARQVARVRIKEHGVLATNERGHVSEMIHGVEPEAESTCCAAARELAVGANAANVAQVLRGESSVVIRKERGPLPRLHRGRQQRALSMRALVKHEGDLGGARVIGILNELMQDADAVGIELEDAVQPAGERLVLAEGLDVLEEEGRE